MDAECCIKLAEASVDSVTKQQQDMVSHCSHRNGKRTFGILSLEIVKKCAENSGGATPGLEV